MPKTPTIRWRDSDSKRLAREVRRFNAKLTREIKRNPAIKEYLPERLNTKDLKAVIKTRADFNREIRSIERFMLKDATAPIESKTGIRTTKWEKNEVALKVRRINRARREELQREQPSHEKGTMGSIRENNLQPKKFDINKIKKSDWEKFVESVEAQVMSTYKLAKMEAYKENYLKAILNSLGNELGAELYEYVRDLPAEFVYRQYYQDPLLQLNFVYDPLQAQLIAETALAHWQYAYQKKA